MFVRAWHTAWDRMVLLDCQSQLREIGWHCRNYADQHHGLFPSLWIDLRVDETNGDWRIDFRCPYGGHNPGAWENIDLWSDYRLIPGRTTNDPPNRILAVENLADHKGTGANVLYVDGSTQWLSVSNLLKADLK